MSRRVAAWLAWTLAALSVALYGAAFVFAFLALNVADPVKRVLAFPIVGALTASKRPRNPIGWICLVTGLFWMSFALGDVSDAYELARTGTARSSVTLDALFQASWVVPVGLLGIYTILLFPDGKLPSRKWRPFALFAGAAMALICVTFVFVPGPLEGHQGVRNPFGLEAYPWLEGVAVFVVLLLPLCILISALSLVLRYRRSGAEVREQIKWLAFAASLVGVTYLSAMIVGIFFVPELFSGGGETPVLALLIPGFMLMSFAGIPIAIGFAVLKYHLYDIDVVINRALIYGPLTGTLILIYFGCVVGLQYALRTLTGEQSTLAVVVSTLLIAALFNPLRRSIQGFIDRRFYRRKYDARKTLEAFSTKLRDETDLEALNKELVGVVRETMQPVQVGLWLREPWQVRDSSRGDRRVAATRRAGDTNKGNE
jgi:hypothetical protein